MLSLSELGSWKAPCVLGWREMPASRILAYCDATAPRGKVDASKPHRFDRDGASAKRSDAAEAAFHAVVDAKALRAFKTCTAVDMYRHVDFVVVHNNDAESLAALAAPPPLSPFPQPPSSPSTASLPCSPCSPHAHPSRADAQGKEVSDYSGASASSGAAGVGAVDAAGVGAVGAVDAAYEGASAASSSVSDAENNSVESVEKTAKRRREQPLSVQGAPLSRSTLMLGMMIELKALKGLFSGDAPQNTELWLELHGETRAHSGWLFGGEAHYIVVQVAASIMTNVAAGLLAPSTHSLSPAELVAEGKDAAATAQGASAAHMHCDAFVVLDRVALARWAAKVANGAARVERAREAFYAIHSRRGHSQVMRVLLKDAFAHAGCCIWTVSR